ncbi:site-specific DNA-methyltransferase [Candidatus Uhrbacteria bacterium UHB]|nr:site-specific DNA-methyltransferase [Candidatus Uhrbacteria bacterium UHB]RIL00169.1 MAG: site-specific DNA-methyltransferase [Candidatus Uhrbacteria bacterium]
MANEFQKVEQAKGRPLLQWVGKKPLESIEYYPAQEKEIYGDKSAKDFNKLFWGDNLQVLAHLLKEHRGAIDLIYIDPPFDSKADYVKKVEVRGEKIEGQQQSLLEEKQYTDIWDKDEWLQFMYERLILMKELMSEKASIFVHIDYHRSSYLRLVMDEVFGEDNFRNEVIWYYPNKIQGNINRLAANHDNIYWYSKTPDFKFHRIEEERAKSIKVNARYWDAEKQLFATKRDGKGNVIYVERGAKIIDDVWIIPAISSGGKDQTDYPTQKPEEILERIIVSMSDAGDSVLDCFAGSGTTCAVAQKLGRRWIGCDINLGAIQTTTKRLNQIIAEQIKEKKGKLLSDFKGSLGFKVFNVNDYDLFNNEVQAKEIVMQQYGVEPIKRSYFDGVLDNNFVKVMPLNRVLNKMDIRTLLKNIGDKLDGFTVKAKSKSGEPIYEEGVLVICSGMELDVADFLKKENKTGVKIEARDIITDKKNLIFRKRAEAKIEVRTKDKKLTVELKDFFSPRLMQKLELENEKVLKKEDRAKVTDFRQIVDSVTIDVDYDGKLFNAEEKLMDLPDKKEVIKGKYEWEYPKKGKYTVAVKIVDVLGEEDFQTFDVTA